MTEKTVQTRTVAVLPIVGALQTALKYKNQPGANWRPSSCPNPKQVELLEKYRKCWQMADKLFTSEEMKYFASCSHEELNTWLKSNGFDIQLGKFKRPDDFGTVSIMDVLVSWLVSGDISSVWANFPTGEKQFPGVCLSGQQNNIQFFQDTSKYPHPVACLQVNDKDTVYMTLADDKANTLSEMGLLDHLSEIARTVRKPTVFKDLYFPMIDLDMQPDISWLCGLNFECGNDSFQVAEALQQTKFKMNEKGARAKSAVAVTVTRSCTMVREPTPPMVINAPFYFWMERETGTRDNNIPHFAAVLGYDCWKNPKNLDM
jgi:hypothetical protein